MRLTQKKIDLAVLFKLFQHAESGSGPASAMDIVRRFEVPISSRRVELAFQKLAERGDIDRQLHEWDKNGGLWQISREGLMAVERALRIPTSFIGRLHLNGDEWLQSAEADAARLKTVTTRVQASAATDVYIDTDVIEVRASARPVNWTKWGTILAGLAIVVSILVAALD